jgi:hypothetical protein
MPLYLQWLIVAAIGLLALWSMLRHLGLGRKKAGCPGCNSCESKPLGRGRTRGGPFTR